MPTAEARRAHQPFSVEALRPMLPSRILEPFDSPDWIFELNWGGIRALAHVQEGEVALRGRHQTDLIKAYPELRSLAAQLRGAHAVLDGEIVALDDQSYPRFELLRPRLDVLLGQEPSRLPRHPFCYQVFDILFWEGEPLLKLPLWQRKNLLHKLLQPSATAQACDFIEREGTAFFEAVCQHRLEGIVAKNKYSPYLPGSRTRQWLEIPAMGVADFVIGGYTFGGGRKGDPFESLLLGAFRGQELVYVGRATGGLARAEGWRTVEVLANLHMPRCPFVNPPALNRFVFWCEPKLVCRVRFGEHRPDGQLRFAVFVSLRPDLSPQDCQLDLAKTA